MTSTCAVSSTCGCSIPVGSASSVPKPLLSNGRTVTPEPRLGGLLYLDVPATGGPVAHRRAIKDFGFDRWDDKSAMLRWIAPENIQVINGHALAPEPRDHVVGASELGPILVSGRRNGQPFVAQFERHGMWYRVAHNGLAIDTQLMSERAAELLRVMPFKAPPDMSKFLLSPMPGVLVDVAVAPGQTVQAGERLAVIEAMKMENILTATQDGIVKEVLAAKGESLAVDQPILSFA